MRKLASIEILDKLEPIPNADRILKATVKGWECVVAKADNFKVGDKVIYIEVDSVLPERPEFDFLKDKKYRVRTIKLRKQISQGLVLPISYLKKHNSYSVGDDVTKELGIKKYDPQVEAEKEILRKPVKVKGIFAPVINFLMRFRWFREFYGKHTVHNCSFPTDIVSKTDEERIQNLPILFEKMKSQAIPLTATEKIDGCSATFFNFDGKFGVCSRNIWLRKEDNSYYWEVARRFQLEEILEALKKEFGAKKVVIQGEIIGQGIQENKYKISGYDFYVYNLIIDGLKLEQDNMTAICKLHNLKTVPVIYKDYVIPNSADFEIKDLVRLASGKSKLLKEQEREGLVFRNYAEGISFKAISPEFLLKEE